MISVVSVSYTHLDVYKRQDFRKCANLENQSFTSECLLRGEMVSEQEPTHPFAFIRTAPQNRAVIFVSSAVPKRLLLSFDAIVVFVHNHG